MRIKILAVWCLTIFIAAHSQENWTLNYDSANFGFFVLDYQSYDFEGGHFIQFPYHKELNAYSIPFLIQYNAPIDSGNVTFLYEATLDTIFSASLWWMGRGRILFPDSLDAPSEFSRDSTLRVHPFKILNLKHMDEISDSLFHVKADSAWLSVRELSILREFDEQASLFRVMVYLYAPSVGMFNPAAAKWIVFLYRGQPIAGVEPFEESVSGFQLKQNYPNPFNPATKLSFTVPHLNQPAELLVYDALGRKVRNLLNGSVSQTRIEVTWDGKNNTGQPVSPGLYLAVLKAGQYTQTIKMMLVE